MNSLDLIGAVGASVLRKRLDDLGPRDGDEDPGTARFMLDRLAPAQIAVICRQVLADADLAGRLEVRIPRRAVVGESLPDEILTDARTVAFRHSSTAKDAILLANTDDDQGTSLKDVTRVGANELKEEPDLWVAAARPPQIVSEGNAELWKVALAGLFKAAEWSLAQVAEYVALTRKGITEHSLAPVHALGWALPALQMPRDTGAFRSLEEAVGPRRQAWRKAFQDLVKQRRPLLTKHTAARQLIDQSDLRTKFDAVREEISPEAHAAIVEFIGAPPNWGPAAAALSEYEWEGADNISKLFSGLRERKKKQPLATETLEFFDWNGHGENSLKKEDRDYLEALAKATAKDPDERDIEFYERHRETLSDGPQLKARWDKWIYGPAVETSDFLEGLLAVVERLYESFKSHPGKRTLVIRTPQGKKSQWLGLNADAGRCFETRYRGLPDLTGARVVWDVEPVFRFEQILQQAEAAGQGKKGGKFKRETSKARAATQIKFVVDLFLGDDRAGQPADSVQLIWQARVDAIGMELPSDLDRLTKKPFIRTAVGRQPVSQKGHLQSVSLSDVASLDPTYGRDAGSLVAKLDATVDLEKTFLKDLREVEDSGALGPDACVRVQAAWERFATSYRAALEGWRTTGISSPALLEQAERFGELLEALRETLTTDVLRTRFLQPVLEFGVTRVEGGPAAAIVAPWHPLRMAAMAAKARSVAGLLDHILTVEEVNIGDARLFFSDLRAELSHAYYPEVAVGYHGTEPVLLTVSDTYADYSLLELPTNGEGADGTDEDPTEGAKRVRALVERYLELQPHEASNLTVALVNCDSYRLPHAAVEALGGMYDEDEVHCNVVLRHRQSDKLARMYGEMLERADSDPDAIVASETSHTFMSKLRVGISLDGVNAPEPTGDKAVDVAFLQDVVSRRAQVRWIDQPAPTEAPSLLEHVPPRWSYRRSASEEELQATVYLVSPRQPLSGWAYLTAVASIVKKEAIPRGTCTIPARRLSVQDHSVQSLLQEVHGIAEWVVNWDDLLDKRQLQAQGVRVIRFQRQSARGRNMVVSSTSELRLLHVLLKRRLADLSLGLDDGRVTALAKRLVDEASTVSGDIVLRAAKRGVFAGELIGVILSRALVQEELGTRTAWFFLDDYAQWLGQREQGIADLLALSPALDDGEIVLRAVVTEAKYINAVSLAEERKGSRQQLRDTVRRIQHALFGAPGRLDRDLWLARISDLLLDAGVTGTSARDFEALRDGVRAGRVRIDLKGYSHVFVSGPADIAVTPEREQLPDVRRCCQEVFSREQVRRLMLAYEADQPLGAVGAELAGDRPWPAAEYEKPATRVMWSATSGLNRSEQLPGEDLGDDGDELKLLGSNGSAPVPTPEGAPASKLTSSTLTHPNPQATGRGTSADASGAEDSVGGTSTTRTPALGTSVQDPAVDDAVQSLRLALLGYNMQAKVVGSHLTPNSILVRFKGSNRISVEGIENKQTALLTEHKLRVLSVTPRPGEIVVALERSPREIIPTTTVWERRVLQRTSSGLNMSFVLGVKELDGELLYLNLWDAFEGLQQHEPHTLVAGATGSGKSVLVQNLLLDIAKTNSSRLAQIHLIDPKMGVDYAAIELLPHLQGGIITEREAAVKLLASMVEEMNRRYVLFRQRAVRDLRTFNERVPQTDRLPARFVVHDEFADWMQVPEYRDEVTALVGRLGAKARGAGIHLIFAAQRPDVNVTPIQLRDNLGNRLILKVSSVGTSEIALKAKGAERLLGKGHLAANLAGEPDIIFAQVPFLADAAMLAAAEAIRDADPALTESIFVAG